MMDLFILELNRNIKSFLFWILLIIGVLFLSTNMEYKIKKPIKSQENYGYNYTEDMKVVRKNFLKDIVTSYIENKYTTYPFGFNKNIVLDDNQKKDMEKLLSAITGESKTEIMKIRDKWNENQGWKLENNWYTNFIDKLDKRSKEAVKDKEFMNLGDEIDNILGGGSSYSSKIMKGKFGITNKNYKDALKEYEVIKEKDRYSSAVSRLFADYMGIYIFLVSSFLPVFLWLKDKKKGIGEVIYSKPISTKKLFLSRFFSNVFAIYLIVLLIGSYYQINIIRDYGINNINFFAIYNISFYWILPIILFSTCIVTMMTIVTNSPIGIVLNFLIWIIMISVGAKNIVGSYSFNLIMRHNQLGGRRIYLDNFGKIVLNRITWIGISTIIIMFTIYFLDRKRGGLYGVKKI